MSTLELQHTISKQLLNINDQSFLKALKTIVDTKVNDEIYHLSEFQRKRIESARVQLKKGKTISHASLNTEIEKWLNTK